MNNTLFVTAGEIAEELGISKPFAYKLVRQMNEELDAKGFLTIAGRIKRRLILYNNISALFEDKERQLWVGTEDYYNFYLFLYIATRNVPVASTSAALKSLYLCKDKLIPTFYLCTKIIVKSIACPRTLNQLKNRCIFDKII